MYTDNNSVAYITFTGKQIGTNHRWVNEIVEFNPSIYYCLGKQTALKRNLNSQILLLGINSNDIPNFNVKQENPEKL